MIEVDDIKRNIREKIARSLGLELASDEQHFFMEAGIDSLAFLNVIQALEKEFLVKFPNDSLPDLSNCTLLATAVVDLVGKKPKAG